jgi:hypothetical protein
LYSIGIARPAYPLLLLLPGPFDYEPDRMLRLFVVEIGMPPTLSEAAAVEALDADKHPFRVILIFSVPVATEAAGIYSIPVRQSRECIPR